ncbi:hypothetical protein PROFUN_10377 [Planoprotostelium fungivorum]|uniref:Uncharacterized protein n=1 Tax=Planoprotostelium fungivorum TaxID=1890364 RepID=A0A2P6NEF0_9EUKA|nr:hypothetical protein PROFUN_10377 [Planoprotostelium fungivorum]
MKISWNPLEGTQLMPSVKEFRKVNHTVAPNYDGETTNTGIQKRKKSPYEFDPWNDELCSQRKAQSDAKARVVRSIKKSKEGHPHSQSDRDMALDDNEKGIIVDSPGYNSINKEIALFDTFVKNHRNKLRAQRQAEMSTLTPHQ